MLYRTLKSCKRFIFDVRLYIEYMTLIILMFCVFGVVSQQDPKGAKKTKGVKDGQRKF